MTVAKRSSMRSSCLKFLTVRNKILHTEKFFRVSSLASLVNIPNWVICVLYRDIFYELIRDWEDHHVTTGWSVRQCQSQKIDSLISLGRDSLANQLHLARLFVLQLVQVFISYSRYSAHTGIQLVQVFSSYISSCLVTSI